MSIKALWKEKIDFEERKGLFFSYGNQVGKVCVRSHYFDTYHHPAQMEGKIMKRICRNPFKMKTKKYKYQRFLPQLLYHKVHQVTDTLLNPLPLRKFGRTIHPQCDVIMVPRYEGNLGEYRKKNLLTLENYRFILFGILYTLHQLQRKYGFVHNDLHLDNILLKVNAKPRPKTYQIEGQTFVIPASAQHYIPIIWDFETSKCFSVESLSTNQLSENQPDVNQFCLVLPKNSSYVLDNTFDRTSIPRELREWILQTYPQHAIPSDVIEEFDYQAEEKLQLHDMLSKAVETNLLPNDLQQSIELYLENKTENRDINYALGSNSTISELEQKITTDDDTTNGSEISSVNTDGSTQDSLTEDHYVETDNYFDYINSEYPRDGVTFDLGVYQMGLESKMDMTRTNPELVYNNRLTNSFPERSILPTPSQLIFSDFFKCWQS